MQKDNISIVVIDDDLSILSVISDLITSEYGYHVQTFSDAVQALMHIGSNPTSVVLTDIVMPRLDGLEVLKKTREYDEKISVILMTGHGDADKMRAAIRFGAFDFLRKPFEFAELFITVKQAVEKNRLLQVEEDNKRHLESLVEQRTIELFSAKDKLEKHYLNTIHAMVNAIEANDQYTRGHSERVTVLSILLGKQNGLSSTELNQLRIGALLHDVGKIGIYDSVLKKNGALSPEEYDMIKMHPIIGGKIISPVGLEPAVHKIILEHHEWIDGCGYPCGLQEDKIHFMARIVAVADAFDAMTSQRPYRKNLDFDLAREEIETMKGRQFDTKVATGFCRNINLFAETVQNKHDVKALLYGKF